MCARKAAPSPFACSEAGPLRPAPMTLSLTSPLTGRLAHDALQAAAGQDDLGPPSIDDVMDTQFEPEQVLLDENAEAAKSDYFSLGGLDVRPRRLSLGFVSGGDWLFVKGDLLIGVQTSASNWSIVLA